MAYSRWGSSRWYTYWVAQSSEVRDPVFRVHTVGDATYNDMVMDFEKVLGKFVGQASKNTPVLDWEKRELAEYMYRFMDDVKRSQADNPDIMLGERVYVGGPMTGKPRWNFPAFDEAASAIRARGGIPACPSAIDRAVWGFDGGEELAPGMCHRSVLPIDFQVLQTCSIIYLLPGWSKSPGAVFEWAAARCFQMKVLFAPGAEQGSMELVPEPAEAKEPILCDTCGVGVAVTTVTCGDCVEKAKKPDQETHINYMHLLDGRPAEFTGKQLTYAWRASLQLRNTLEEILADQAVSKAFRTHMGFDHKAQMSYQRVCVPL